jgi:hypothetical protein
MSILIHYMPETSFIRITEFHMLTISATLISLAFKLVVVVVLEVW